MLLFQKLSVRAKNVMGVCSISGFIVLIKNFSTNFIEGFLFYLYLDPFLTPPPSMFPLMSDLSFHRCVWRQTDAFTLDAQHPANEEWEFKIFWKKFWVASVEMTAFCNKEIVEMFGKQQSAETLAATDLVGSLERSKLWTKRFSFFRGFDELKVRWPNLHLVG